MVSKSFNIFEKKRDRNIFDSLARIGIIRPWKAPDLRDLLLP